MSVYRIDDRVVAFTPGGPVTWAISGPTYPPVSGGALWLNTDYSAADWGRDSLFLDVMRTARGWRAQTSGQYDDAAKRAEMMATADADGYPTVLPADTAAGTIVLLEQGSASAPALGGRYRLEYQGAGALLLGGVSNQTTGVGYIEFDFTPTDSNSIDIRITATASGNHIRGLKCYLVAHAALAASGQVVHPAFDAAYGGIGLLRFMLAQDTNKNAQSIWADAPQPTSIGRGVSWLEMVKVCNELGCHGWFHFPYAATADYVTQAATIVRDNLNPALKAYFEYGNECWNSSYNFDCYPYLDALRAGKSYNVYEQWGGRSTECMVAASAVFAGQMERIVRVMGVQTGYLGLETNNLYAPGWVAEVGGRVVPHTVHDAIAVTGYFNCEYSQWPAVVAAAATDYATGRALMLAKVQEEIDLHQNSYWPHHKAVANGLGKQLIMYEGGSHLYNPGGHGNDALANQLVAEVNRGDLIVDKYAQQMTNWELFSSVAGGFNQFSATRTPTATGEFGALQNINVATPRHTAIMGYNAGTFPVVAGIDPLPLNQRIVIGGHSITDAIARAPLADAITAMGGTVAKWTATGAHATMQNRWNNPVESGTPDNIKALMEAGGADYDAFLTIEAHGGSYAGRTSVVEHIRWSDSYAVGVQWMNLAASTGAQTYFANFWRNDSARVFGADWRASHSVVIWDGAGGGNTGAQNLTELEAYNNLLDTINANRAGGTPVVRLVPWLDVFLAVYDAIQAGTVTGITMADIMSDDVHPDTPQGRWILVATLLAVVYRRHPDELPANVGAAINVSSGLAAQLRPIVWATCLATARAGLSA